MPEITEKELHEYRLKRSKRHSDERIVNVPVGYLQWMVNSGHSEADYAEAELKRRGSVFPDLEVSNHAVDRMYLKCRDRFERDRAADEGPCAWTLRVAREALDKGRRVPGVNGKEKIHWKGMKLAFTGDTTRWPVLVTIMPNERQQDRN